MTDRTEERLRETFGELKPNRPKERVLANLPADRVTKSPAPRMFMGAAALAVAACLVALIVFRPASELPENLPPEPGGTRLLFQVGGDADAVVAVMESRLKARGIEGAVVRTSGPDGIVEVLLPEGADSINVSALLMKPGVLEFRVVVEIDPDAEAPPGTEWHHDEETGEPILVELPAETCDDFGGADLDPAGTLIRRGQYGTSWVVGFAMIEERMDEFADFTSRIVKRKLAIIVDGSVTSAPMVLETLPGRGQISGGGVGGFSRDEAEAFAAILRSGPLPSEVTPLDPR